MTSPSAPRKGLSYGTQVNSTNGKEVLSPLALELFPAVPDGGHGGAHHYPEMLYRAGRPFTEESYSSAFHRPERYGLRLWRQRSFPWDATSIAVDSTPLGGTSVHHSLPARKQRFYEVAEIARACIGYFSTQNPASLPLPLLMTIFNGYGQMEYLDDGQRPRYGEHGRHQSPHRSRSPTPISLPDGASTKAPTPGWDAPGQPTPAGVLRLHRTVHAEKPRKSPSTQVITCADTWGKRRRGRRPTHPTDQLLAPAYQFQLTANLHRGVPLAV